MKYKKTFVQKVPDMEENSLSKNVAIFNLCPRTSRHYSGGIGGGSSGARPLTRLTGSSLGLEDHHHHNLLNNGLNGFPPPVANWRSKSASSAYGGRSMGGNYSDGEYSSTIASSR